MIITKRIVKAGKITGYEVEDNGVRTVLDANTVLAHTDDITDARALDERYYRTNIEYNTLHITKDTKKHTYINPELVHDFREKKTEDSIYNDLYDKYDITNVADDDESYHYIWQAIYDDYMYERCNYEAFIEKGMNARLLMEHRKSAMFRFEKEEDKIKFYTEYNYCQNAEDVKKVRRKFFKQGNMDYEDLGWQYYYLAEHFLGKDKCKDFYFDLEDCFADGDASKQETIEDYNTMFFRAHMPPSLWY